ncbi:type III-B CRISPR module-associated protein Cmr5 [Caminibacter sp.]
MAIKDLENERAQFAFKCVSNVYKFENESILKNYLIKKLVKSNKKEKDEKEQEINDKREELESYWSNRDIDLKFVNNEEIEKVINDYGKDYKSYVRKIPMMILNHGLAPTFAFVYSKKKDGNAWELIYAQTTKWLKEEKELINSDELIEALINKKSQEYRMITNEVLALFEWLKRFAEGMIEDRKDGEG